MPPIPPLRASAASPKCIFLHASTCVAWRIDIPLSVLRWLTLSHLDGQVQNVTIKELQALASAVQDSAIGVLKTSSSGVDTSAGLQNQAQSHGERDG